MPTQRQMTLTDNQARVVIRVLCQLHSGKEFSVQMLETAHDEAYKLSGDPKRISLCMKRNLESEPFVSLLASPEAPPAEGFRSTLRSWINDYEEHPDRAILAAKILCPTGLRLEDARERARVELGRRAQESERNA